MTDKSSDQAKENTNRASLRFSTISKASETPTYSTEASDAPTYSSQQTDPEIREYERSVQRMEDRRTEDQRYPISQKKADEMEKLAVMGKVEKSLKMRYSNQDATMRAPSDKKRYEKPTQSGQPESSKK